MDQGRTGQGGAATGQRSGAELLTTVLLFEPEHTGHHADYLHHVLDHWTRCPEGERPRIALLTTRTFQDRFWRGRRWAERFEPLHVEVHVLDEAEQEACNQPVLWKRGLARWGALRRYGGLSGADHVMAMELDHLQLPLALRLSAGGHRVSGILFRPSTHYRAMLEDATPATMRERMKNIRKALVYRAMLRHPDLGHVLSLDPFFPAYARRTYRHGERVSALPDPALFPDAVSAPQYPLVKLPAGRRFFLLFGALARRKGVIPLLAALRRLDAGEAARAAVVLAGVPEEQLRARLSREIEATRRARPELFLHLEDRYLERAEIAELVRRCDVVLAPYQRFVGSSGVLLWAAGAGKPVITQSYGLLGEWTRRHRLGTAVDTSSPAALVEAIRSYLEEGDRDDGAVGERRAFAAQHTPERFGRTIVEKFAGSATG